MPVHRKLRTGEKAVPWSAVFILSLMWFTFGFHIFAGGQALTFTIQHYSKDPQVISIIGTFATVLMLAPLVSYLSDQVWTRAGRRRPFLLVSWAGGCLGMYAFAFLPQVTGAINGTLGLVGIPPVAEIFLLAAIVGGYKKMLDCMAPLEPLFLECVPPGQRGRFWAVRGILFTCAVMLFYQVLWPVFDDPVDLFGYLGLHGVLVLKGEQLVYLFAGTMFLITGFYLVFCVEETRVPDAPNHSLREMFLGGGRTPVRRRSMRDVPIVAFLRGFLRDVFLKWGNYPFYIILVIPTMEAAVWGSFGALMQNDQFGYSKANQALWALPMGIVSMCILTPFAGWYSDIRIRVKWPVRFGLLAVSASAMAAMVWMYRHYLPEQTRELPDLWVLFTMTGLTALGVGTFYVALVETILDRVGREHARAWVSLLTVAKSMVNVVLLYVWIRMAPGHVPPILSWMVFAVVTGTLGALMDTFIGPMIYDYMPRSQMGTINSGVGIYNTIITFLVANLGAWWVVFYTDHFGPWSSGAGRVWAELSSNTALQCALLNFTKARPYFDYTSMYLLQFAFFLPAIAAKLYFIRLILKGRMKKWGVMEVEGAPGPAGH